MKNAFSSAAIVAVLMFAGCSEESPSPPANSAGNGSSTGASTASEAASNADAGSATSATPDAAAAATPEAAFESFRQALKNDDWESGARHLTDKSQAMMAFSMLMAGGMMGAFDPEKGKAVEELFRKHGVDPSQEPDIGSPDGGVLSMPQMMTAGIGDKPKFIGEMTALMESDSEGGMSGSPVDGELQNVQINGDAASGVVVHDGGEEPIEFVRVDGRWLIELPEPEMMASGGPGNMAMDGEFGSGWSDDDFSNWQWDNFEQPDLDPPGQIPVEEFDAAWQVSIDESAVPAGDLLRRLADELHLEWVEPKEELPQLRELVSVSISGVSRLQAIEQITEQVGLHPRYLMKKITVAAGPRESGVGFAGPFLVEVGEVEELIPAGAAQLTLRVHAHGLTEAAVSLLSSLQPQVDAEDSDWLTLHITEQTGTGGKSLKHPGHDGFGFSPSYTETAIQWTVPVPLLNTTKSVADVEMVKGELSFVLPVEVETLTFESLEPGAKLTSGDASFELVSADGGSVEVEYRNADADRLSIVARDAAGDSLQDYGTSSYGDAESGTIAVHFEGEVASADIVFKKQTERVRYPFEVHDIPLPGHDEQPESIPELTFDGSAPLTVEFVKFQKNEFDQDAAEVTISNTSNRDVRGYNVLLHYLNDAGEEIDNFPFSSFGVEFPAGETVTDALTTPFLPEETKSVRIEVTQATFADLTSWSAEQQ
ncbi:MAG: hypothetical protein R3C19_04650 [Planctomycetaceae bacterium]